MTEFSVHRTKLPYILEIRITGDSSDLIERKLVNITFCDPHYDNAFVAISKVLKILTYSEHINPTDDTGVGLKEDD